MIVFDLTCASCGVNRHFERESRDLGSIVSCEACQYEAPLSDWGIATERGISHQASVQFEQGREDLRIEASTGVKAPIRAPVLRASSGLLPAGISEISLVPTSFGWFAYCARGAAGEFDNKMESMALHFSDGAPASVDALAHWMEDRWGLNRDRAREAAARLLRPLLFAEV